ncbi:hypothetical protein C8R44DRAFT_746638 [Mycena epipterygia]|nr:hypothetical protein C8R44DRAFT_746638 [Mycena epipterygia]
MYLDHIPKGHDGKKLDTTASGLGLKLLTHIISDVAGTDRELMHAAKDLISVLAERSLTVVQVSGPTVESGSPFVERETWTSRSPVSSVYGEVRSLLMQWSMACPNSSVTLIDGSVAAARRQGGWILLDPRSTSSAVPSISVLGERTLTVVRVSGPTMDHRS